jgi:hypothetical protein
MCIGLLGSQALLALSQKAPPPETHSRVSRAVNLPLVAHPVVPVDR